MTDTTVSTDDEDDVAEGPASTARRELAAAIRRGDYTPNQRLVETELSAVLGISRATLRTVFVALEQENYISLERHRGARVRQFSPEEAMEILLAREVLESATAGLAAENITAAEAETLRGIMLRMIEHDGTGDGRAYSQCNREFHATILAAARHPTLARFLAATPYPLVMSQYRDLDARHPRDNSLKEHQAILAALLSGNRAATEEAMRFHIRHARQALALRTGMRMPEGS